MSTIGHNSDPQTYELVVFAERIERLEEEKQALSGDIREVYAEVKSAGFDTKILRKALALRRKTKAEREEEQMLIDTYLAAIGAL
jgi:uncharacterized protein (UPF0335 family)